MNNIKKHSQSFAILMWLLGALFYFYEFLLQVSPGVMVKELMQAFAVNATALGTLSAVYFYAYASMQIPVGVMIDHLGPRKLITAAVLTCALGCVVFAATSNLIVAGIGRGLIGLGSAFAAVGCMSIAIRWFPAKRFALLTGLMLMIGMLGASFGEAPLALLVDHLHWRQTLFLFAGVGVVLAILIFSVVRDAPANSPFFSTTKKPQGQLTIGLKHVVKSWQSWLAAIYGGFMYIPTSAFGALWGVSFLMTAYHLSKPIAATYVSMIFIGWAVGSPFFGAISDYIRRRKPPMVIGSIGALLTMTTVIYVPNLPAALLTLLLFSFGFFSSGFLMTFSLVREINPTPYSATSLGFTNTLNMIGAAIAQTALGWILDLHWGGQLENGARIYPLSAYHMAFSLIPAVILLSLFMIPFIRETQCQHYENLQATTNN